LRTAAAGTDYPYDMAESDPVAHLVCAEQDGASVAAIAGGNVRQLLKL
jgi:aminocarboxymuconate-semialdehyde decarboxylase